jgi:hypothetical protein
MPWQQETENSTENELNSDNIYCLSKNYEFTQQLSK